MEGFYKILAYSSFGLAIVLFIIAVFLFFKLKIYSSIGILSGKTAKKQMRKMRVESENRIKRNRADLLPQFENMQFSENLAYGSQQTVLLNESTGNMPINGATMILNQESKQSNVVATEKLIDSHQKMNHKLWSKDEFQLVTNIVVVHTIEQI